MRADDGNRYWCKVINNGQGERVPVTEQIVARLGVLIGAPVCEPMLVYIPADLAGWEFRDGMPLVEGWAHGSLAADPVVETRALADRTMDQNSRRHAGIYAVYDWTFGADQQWLIRGADREYLSHDHGWYLPPGGPDWTPETLAAAIGTPNELEVPTGGLDRDEIERVAGRLEELSVEDLELALSKLPDSWPVSDSELDAVVAFAHARREPVAARLRAHILAV